MSAPTRFPIISLYSLWTDPLGFTEGMINSKPLRANAYSGWRCERKFKEGLWICIPRCWGGVELEGLCFRLTRMTTGQGRHDVDHWTRVRHRATWLLAKEVLARTGDITAYTASSFGHRTRCNRKSVESIPLSPGIVRKYLSSCNNSSQFRNRNLFSSSFYPNESTAPSIQFKVLLILCWRNVSYHSFCMEPLLVFFRKMGIVQTDYKACRTVLTISFSHSPFESNVMNLDFTFYQTTLNRRVLSFWIVLKLFHINYIWYD